jgi:predicted metal-dependent peptidase
MAQAATAEKKWFDHKLDGVTTFALPEIELNATQERSWTEARAKFLWDAPGFCSVMYSMMNPRRREVKAIFTDQVPLAATDGLYMMLNPATFLKLKLSERVFVMAHEVLHAIMNHAVQMYNARMRGKVAFTDGQSLPFNDDLYQIAMDFVINAILVQSKIGTMPEKACIDPWYKQNNPQGNPTISHMDSVPDAYRKLWKDDPSHGGAGKLGVRSQQGFDIVLNPGKAEGKSPEVAKQQRSEQEWKVAVAAAMESARVQGKLSGAMKDVFGEVLEPRVSWQDYITGFFKRRLGGGSYNFRRADRRLITRDPFIYAPARSGYGAENVVVAVDTSGSIDKAELTMFFGEMQGVLDDVNPQNLYVMWCDAQVHRVDEVEDTGDLIDMWHAGAPGRLGTSFVPVFEKVREMGIKLDALIYLTDGHGTFGDEPGYPVLWGSIDKQPEGYPWGEVVMIPKVQP